MVQVKKSRLIAMALHLLDIRGNQGFVVALVCWSGNYRHRWTRNSRTKAVMWDVFTIPRVFIVECRKDKTVPLL